MSTHEVTIELISLTITDIIYLLIYSHLLLVSIEAISKQPIQYLNKKTSHAHINLFKGFIQLALLTKYISVKVVKAKINRYWNISESIFFENFQV